MSHIRHMDTSLDTNLKRQLRQEVFDFVNRFCELMRDHEDARKFEDMFVYNLTCYMGRMRDGEDRSAAPFKRELERVLEKLEDLNGNQTTDDSRG